MHKPSTTSKPQSPSKREKKKKKKKPSLEQTARQSRFERPRRPRRERERERERATERKWGCERSGRLTGRPKKNEEAARFPSGQLQSIWLAPFFFFLFLFFVNLSNLFKALNWWEEEEEGGRRHSTYWTRSSALTVQKHEMEIRLISSYLFAKRKQKNNWYMVWFFVKLL